MNSNPISERPKSDATDVEKQSVSTSGAEKQSQANNHKHQQNGNGKLDAIPRGQGQQAQSNTAQRE